MKAAVIIELKGFSAIAVSLAEKMSGIGLTDAKIRSVMREFIHMAMLQVEAMTKSNETIEIGGDTWVLKFDDVDRAINWGVRFYKVVERIVINNGVSYLKPSIALALGDLKFQGDRFLDAATIQGYRSADKGQPFEFYAVGDAADYVAKMQHAPSDKSDAARIILWQKFQVSNVTDLSAFPISFAHLLLDNEVLFFRTHGEVISFLKEQQFRSREIRVYGGPAPLRTDFYRGYAASIANLLENFHVRCSVLNYLNEGAPDDAVSWLLLCRALQTKYPAKFAYAAYLLPANAIKPVAYHVYDDVTVLMLRSFDEFSQTHSVSGSIVIRGAQISQRFREDFVESFRSVARFDDAKFDAVIQQLVAKGADLTKAQEYVAAALGSTSGR